jgi:hypothetical protein
MNIDMANYMIRLEVLLTSDLQVLLALVSRILSKLVAYPNVLKNLLIWQAQNIITIHCLCIMFEKTRSLLTVKSLLGRLKTCIRQYEQDIVSRHK